MVASVEDEYKKNKELRKEDVQMLVDWMETQPHLPKVSELEVILFLHSCYYSIEFTKKTIDTYYTCRTHCPEFFQNRDPRTTQMQNDMNLVVFNTLPELTNEGYRVIFAKVHHKDASLFGFTDQMRCLTMLADLSMIEEGTALGHYVLFDMNGFTMAHFTKFSVMPLKQILFYLQEAIPIRLKGFHFFNIVPFIDKFMLLLRPFLKKELYDSFHLYKESQMENLYDFIPKRCMPEDYGGEGPSIKQLHDSMKQKITDNAEYFISTEKTHRVDEKKRPDKAQNPGEFWGVEGSFKKLDID